MHGNINVKSPNNISEWQMGFNSAFKGLNYVNLSSLCQYGLYVSCDLFKRVKIKVILGRVCTGWWRRTYNSNTSATSTLGKGGWSAQYSSHFSRERYPRPSVQEAGQIAGSFWRGTGNLAAFGFDPRPSSLQSVPIPTEPPRPLCKPVNIRNGNVYCQIQHFKLIFATKMLLACLV